MEAVSTFYSEVEVSPERIVRVISADLGLCIQVLKAANSAYFNPLSLPMNTISRAAVLLGFDNLKQIALSAPKLEEKTLKQESFLREYALSLLTAHLAEGAAEKRSINAEEAYLTGLFRRLGRLILLIYSPRTYREINSLSEARQKELFLLVGERMARHWNLPSQLLEGLEGREKLKRQGRLLRLVILAEKIALSLLEEGLLYGWQRLFDSPQRVKLALENLKEKLPYLPPPLRDALSDWLQIDQSAFETEAPPEEDIFYLPREAISLVRRAMKALSEEMEAEGKVFYLEDNHLESLDEEPPSPEAEKFLLEILRKGEVFRGSGAEEFVYLPLCFAGRPAILLGFKRREPFTEKEIYGLNLLKKTLEGLLSKF